MCKDNEKLNEMMRSIRFYNERQQYRKPGHDYSREGSYFVTICTKDKVWDFGEVINGKMQLSEIGNIANKFWKEIPNSFKNARLDNYIIMPNHLHGIIDILSSTTGSSYAPRRVATTSSGIHPLVKNSLSSIINHYKGNVKRYCNDNNLEYFIWQPRFHDRIIRDEKEYFIKKNYIKNNPRNWEHDEFYYENSNNTV